LRSGVFSPENPVPEAPLSRRVRVLLALVAAPLLLAGAWLARVRIALELHRIFDALAANPEPTARDLVEPMEALRATEVLGEALLGLGLVLLVVLGARAVRTPRGVAILAIVVALAAPIANVLRPTTTVPAMLTIVPPSGEWPFGAVLADKAHWNAYMIITAKEEWAVTFEGSQLGPEGLALALDRRFAKPGGKRPVTLYLDPRCPPETQDVFTKSVEQVTKPAAVELTEDVLPARDDFYVVRRRNRERQLEPFRDTILATTAARFAAAVALALVTWWADRNARTRGATVVAGAHLVLALGFAFSVPVTLYAAMLPDSSGGRSAFDHVAQNVLPHVGMLMVSAVGIAVGAIIAAIGHAILDESAVVPIEDAATIRRKAFRARAAARPEKTPETSAPEPTPPPPAASTPEPAPPPPDVPPDVSGPG
jgi:hypothetical protein